MKVLPLICLLSLSATIAAGSSIGGDGSEPEDGTHLRGGIPDDAEGEDLFLGHHVHFERYLRDLAEELNIGLDETKKFLLQRQEFIEHTRDLRKDANFLNSELADTPDGEFILRYKNGDVPQKSWEGVDKFKEKHGDAVVNLVSTRLSRKDALERARRLSDILKKKAYTNVGYEIYGDDIHVTAKQPQGQGQGQGMRLLTRADAASIMTLDDDHDDLVGLSLHLVGHDQESPYQSLSSDDPFGVPDAEYVKAGVGGTIMQGSGSRRCTSGFAVKHEDTGDEGILTAGHCKVSEYRKKKKGNKNKWVDMFRQKRHLDKYGDFAWYTPKQKLDMKPYFFINHEAVIEGDHGGHKKDWALFPVNLAWDDIGLNEGSTVFCYSRNHQEIFRYKVVTSDGTFPPCKGNDYNEVEDLIVLRGETLVPGDSGGPCWGYADYDELTVVAVGILTAYEKPDTMYITKIWNAQDQLGVRVMTTKETCDETEYPCKIPKRGPFMDN